MLLQVPSPYIFTFRVSDAISVAPSPPGYKVTSGKHIVFSSSPSANLTSSHQACRIDFWRK